MWQSILLISSGAILGALSRWFIGLCFNPMFSGFAFGMLVANLVSCFFIGVFTALCWHLPAISDHWKLLFVTGFFGSLSTISSLTAEVMTNILHDKIALGVGLLSAHIVGTLIATFLGIVLVNLIFR